MTDIWLVSDTHFSHANIIRYCNRPFSSAEEMDEVMIERWNKVVKPNDKVYHLGDVGLSNRTLDTILSRLNGKKRLILGNHDDGKNPILLKHFQKIFMWRKLGEFGLILTHVPVHVSTLGEGRGPEFVNVHGHIHTDMVMKYDHNNIPMVDTRYVNVCVEQINYTPVHIDMFRIW